MNECIFCQIINGQAPSYKLGENKDALAILNLYPFSSAHALIISKEHCARFSDLPTSTAQGMIALAVPLAQKMRENYNITDLNYLVNEGKNAGQSVFHAHLHVISKTTNPETGLIQKSVLLNSPATDELQELQKKLAF